MSNCTIKLSWHQDESYGVMLPCPHDGYQAFWWSWFCGSHLNPWHSGRLIVHFYSLLHSKGPSTLGITWNCTYWFSRFKNSSWKYFSLVERHLFFFSRASGYEFILDTGALFQQCGQVLFCMFSIPRLFLVQFSCLRDNVIVRSSNALVRQIGWGVQFVWLCIAFALCWGGRFTN